MNTDFSTPDSASARRRENIILFVIVAAAFALRVAGNGFGLPDELNVDEAHFVPRAIRFGTGDLNPHFFLYPTLYMYMLFAAYAIYFVFGRVTGVFPSAEAFAIQYFDDPTAFYLIGRTMTALMGAATVFLVILILRRLRPRAAVAGGILAAVIPLHSLHSHFVTADVPMTFFTVLVLWLSLNIIRRGAARDYAAAGLAVGLGMAVKYTNVAAFAAVLIAHIACVHGRRRTLNPIAYVNVPIIIAGAAAGAGFIAGCPYSVLDFTAFKTDVLLTLQKVGGLWLGLENVRNMWLTILIDYLPGGATWPLYAAALAGLVYMAARRNAEEFLFPAFAVVFYLVVGRNAQNFPRYWIPLLPIFAVAAGILAHDVTERLGKLRLAALAAIVAALAAAPAGISVADSLRMKTEKDTRTAAREWIERNIPSGAKVAVEIQGPALKPTREALLDAATRGRDGKIAETTKFDNINSADRSAVEHSATNKKFHLAAIEKAKHTYHVFSTFSLAEYPMEFYEQNGIEYLVTCSGVSDRYLAAEKDYPAAAAFYKSLKSKLKLVKIISPERGETYGGTIRVFRLR